MRDELSRKSISDSLKFYYSNNECHVPWNKGKTFSIETKKRQSESRKKFFESGGKNINTLQWVTPVGVFNSYHDLKIIESGLTFKQVQKRCQERCDLVITKTAAVGIKDFNAFPFVGKTWRELGWYTQQIL